MVLCFGSGMSWLGAPLQNLRDQPYLPPPPLRKLNPYTYTDDIQFEYFLFRKGSRGGTKAGWIGSRKSLCGRQQWRQLPPRVQGPPDPGTPWIPPELLKLAECVVDLERFQPFRIVLCGMLFLFQNVQGLSMQCQCLVSNCK